MKKGVYYPRGAGSHVYGNSFIKYLRTQLCKNEVLISVGAQPNSEPHLGTIIVFSTAFSLARKLMNDYPELNCRVQFEMVDTAPGFITWYNNRLYQRSLRNVGMVHLSSYNTLLRMLREYFGIEYLIRGQFEFNESEYVYPVLRKIIQESETVALYLDPEFNNLRIRPECPECGLSDKLAHTISIQGDHIYALCPIHGQYCVDIRTQRNYLGYNTPLRNMIRHLVYALESVDANYDHCWLRVTGSDYAGFYQEQTLYRASSAIGYRVDMFPPIIYAPLVSDWSGAKLSKSLYLEKDAYDDIPRYLLDYTSLIDAFGDEGLLMVFELVKSWIDEPYKLFRSYSAEYFQDLFQERFFSNNE